MAAAYANALGCSLAFIAKRCSGTLHVEAIDAFREGAGNGIQRVHYSPGLS
jgi:hypothetical protein